MPQINVLPKHLVNKIAAGEVIERPASVLKELVENAVDAGATRIDVTVEDGGRKAIVVSDNGCGMSEGDLALAFAAHATSKITVEDDLEAIMTMGFRGEALASIASIAHAHIRSRRNEDDAGHEIEATGETVSEVKPCAAAVGTTISIRNLFFNTPARRKFMRTRNTEYGHMVEQLTRLALPHPQVAFSLTHDGRETMSLPATESTISRVRDIFTADMAESLLPITRRGGNVDVAGFVAPPSAARGSGKWQYFFLNGRYIRDRVLAHALREAYRGLVDPNRYPVAFVFLQVKPADVDVNVHPTKIEVRFRDSQAVHGELLAALKETLNKSNLTPRASFESTADPFGEPAKSADTADKARQDSLRQAMADFFKSTPPSQPRFAFPDAPPKAARNTTPATTVEEISSAPAMSPKVPATVPVASPTELRPAIQINNTYIVSADDDGLIIIDQHALHERILYNDMRRRLTDGPLTGQQMLIPETLTVTVAEAAAVEEHAGIFARLGLEVAQFGPETLAVQKFPILLAQRGAAPGLFLRECIDKLTEDETADGERLIEDLLEMLACKAAIKAGDPLTGDEINELMARGDETEKASSCPHGRPTTLRLSTKDLEKQFKRT